MENKIFVGVITSTHGIKGELKVKSDFELKEKVFKKGFKIRVDDKICEITSFRRHKDYEMITIDNVFDINLVTECLRKKIYICREDLGLKNNEYLMNDLIGFSVYDSDELIGEVIDIRYNIISKFIYVEGSKNFYIPFIDEFIKEVDLLNKKIITKNGKGLIL